MNSNRCKRLTQFYIMIKHIISTDIGTKNVQYMKYNREKKSLTNTIVLI